VRRQNEAIKIGNETQEKQSVSTSVKRVTKVVSQSAQKVVLQDDVIFVNNGAATTNGIQAGSTTGNGTAEQPVDTIQAGANLAQSNSNSSARVWNVYTQGTAAGYTEDVSTTTGSVHFMGSGKGIAGVGGANFGTGPAPAVSGGFFAEAIPYFGLTAYTVTDGLVALGRNGVLATDVGTVNIKSNLFNNTVNDSIQLELTGATAMKATIDGNRSIGGNSGLFAPISGNGAVLNITVTNYNISATDFSGLHLEAANSASINAVVRNNQVNLAGNVGIRNNNFGTGAVNVRLDGNKVTAPTIDGYKAERTGAGALILNGTNNTVSGEGALKFSSGGAPTGKIMLNGVPVVLPSNVP
jgi:hypothetical protein